MDIWRNPVEDRWDMDILYRKISFMISHSLKRLVVIFYYYFISTIHPKRTPSLIGLYFYASLMLHFLATSQVLEMYPCTSEV